MLKCLTAVICALWLLISVPPIHAGSNQSELASCRCLIPEWGKTNGGFSPAISPNGKTLAFMSFGYVENKVEECIWITEVDPADFTDTSVAVLRPQWWLSKTWKLDINLHEIESSDIVAPDPGDVSQEQNIAWSPDGKKLAFVYQGRLCLAENLDFKQKTAKIKILADVKTQTYDEVKKFPYWIPEDKKLFALPVLEPRWSPDGNRIAFLRFNQYWKSGNHDLYVLDLKTSKETVIAYDAKYLSLGPWSLDGKHLVYTYGEKDESNRWNTGASIVATDGSEPARKIGVYATNAIWSSDTNTLVVDGIYKINLGKGNMQKLTRWIPPEKEIEERQSMLKRYKQLVKDRYSENLSTDMIKKLDDENTDMIFLYNVSFLGEARIREKGLGKDFQQLTDEFEKSLLAERYTDHAQKLRDDMARLIPHDNWNESHHNIINLEWIANPDSALLDSKPVCSPVGKSIAFIRRDLRTEEHSLGIVDIKTHDERILFNAEIIDNATWTSDGKRLIFQTRRNLGQRRGSGGDWVSVPSYPEIWMVELK